MQGFFEYYDQHVISKSSLQRLQLSKTKNEKEMSEFEDGPPCLQTLASQGAVSEGGRNNYLYNIGVYLKKKDPAGWESKIEDYNDSKYISPKIKSEEVLKTIGSLNKKEYDYKCKDQPICDFCNDKLCYTRKFGKSGSPDIDITQIRMLDSDPPIYFVTADGETMECDPDTLHDPDKFSKHAMIHIRKTLLSTNKMMWKKRINKLLAEMDDPLAAPDDMRIDVILQNGLTNFVSKNGKQLEDVLKRKSYSENGHSWFKFDDFWRYLLASKQWADKTYNKQKTNRMIQNLFNATTVAKKINDQSVKLWQIEGLKLQEKIVRKNIKKKAEFEK